jgi:hypothetical protein
MEIKVIAKIEKHSEFNKTYMNKLYVCQQFRSADESKQKNKGKQETK